MRKSILDVIQTLINKVPETVETRNMDEGVIRNTFVDGELDEIQNYLRKTFEV